MKKFHITITENETGKTSLDTDTDAIIAGVDLGERTQICCRVHCVKTDHAFLIDSLRGSLDKQEAEDPALALLLRVLKAQKETETQEN